MPGKRDAHERFPELIAAAVHVFTRAGYPLARMSGVAAEMGLSEAAVHRYVGSKEVLFVPAIRHSLVLEDLPAGDLPLSPAPLTWFTRHRFSDPDGAAITAGLAADTAVDALVHALIPAIPVVAGGR
jgi:AcrR family transcriptional regulator